MSLSALRSESYIVHVIYLGTYLSHASASPTYSSIIFSSLDNYELGPFPGLYAQTVRNVSRTASQYRQDTALCVSDAFLKPLASCNIPYASSVPCAFRLLCFSEGWTGNKVSGSGSGPLRDTYTKHTHATAAITSSCQVSCIYPIAAKSVISRIRPELPVSAGCDDSRIVDGAVAFQSVH